jgi:hypothetical protein
VVPAEFAHAQHLGAVEDIELNGMAGFFQQLDQERHQRIREKRVMSVTDLLRQHPKASARTITAVNTLDHPSPLKHAQLPMGGGLRQTGSAR